MKRFTRFFFVTVLCVVIMAMLGMASYAQDPATLAVGTAQVTYTAVNVRVGPGTNYAIAGHMTNGTLVPVLDFTPVNGFVKVSFEGSVRYVHQSSIKSVATQPIQKTPDAPKTVAAPKKADPTAVIDRVTIVASALNVRTGPSKSSPVVGRLTAGTVVPVIDYNGGNGYALISYQGDVRYAYLNGYSTRVTADTVAPAAPAAPATGTARVTANVLNVRSGPGMEHAVVGKLTRGTQVPVIAYNAGNGFALISYQGDLRYVAVQWLAF